MTINFNANDMLSTTSEWKWQGCSLFPPLLTDDSIFNCPILSEIALMFLFAKAEFNLAFPPLTQVLIESFQDTILISRSPYQGEELNRWRWPVLNQQHWRKMTGTIQISRIPSLLLSLLLKTDVQDTAPVDQSRMTDALAETSKEQLTTTVTQLQRQQPDQRRIQRHTQRQQRQ